MPVRGDIVVANSVPAWSALAKGTQNKILSMGANDPAWIDSPTLVALTLSGLLSGMTDIYRIGFTDYSGSTSLVGWTGTPSPFILRYKLVGRFCQVWVNIVGTSNSATTSLTLPYAAKTLTSLSQRQSIGTQDNGVWTSGIIAPGSGSATFTAYLSHGLTTWVASGTKTIIGSFWYETDS